MKNNKEFENFNDIKGNPEVYTFSEVEHNKQLSGERFSFVDENNFQQTGTDSNVGSAGIEDNDNFASSSISEDNEERREENRSDNTSSSSSSSSSSASSSSSVASASTSAATTAASSSVMATVAASATAAVVLVVGGGVVMNEVFKEPTICQFQEVAVMDNNVHFMLMLGTDEDKIISGEENDETDCVVEISSPLLHYYDELEVKNFGVFNGEFSNLEYDTQYSLNVYRPTMMGADREYLIPEGYMINTPKKEVEPEPDPQEILVTSITLSNENIEMNVGETFLLSATLLPENATDKTIEWRTNDVNVATVNNGEIYAVSAGSAIIYAYAGDTFAMCEVVVSDKEPTSEPDIPVTGIELEEHELSVEVGDIFYLNVIFTPEGASDTLLWSSSDTNKVVVNAVGEIYAFGTGEVTITVTCGDYSDECIIYVNPKTVHATSVNIVDFNQNPYDEIKLEVGSYITLYYTIEPVNATDQTVTWTSSNPSLLEITQERFGECTVKAKGNGEVTFTAASTSDPDIYDTVTFYLYGGDSSSESTEIERFGFSVPNATLPLEEYIPSDVNSFNVYDFLTVYPSGASLDGITFTSSDPDVMTIDNESTIHGLDLGTAILTATVGSFEASMEIEFIIPVTSLELDGGNEININVGDTYNFDFIIAPENATSPTSRIKYEILSGSDYIQMDGGTSVTGLSVGTAYLAFICDYAECYLNINVSEGTSTPEAIVLNYGGISIEKDSYVDIVGYIEPGGDYTSYTFSWAEDSGGELVSLEPLGSNEQNVANASCRVYRNEGQYGSTTLICYIDENNNGQYDEGEIHATCALNLE